MSHSLAARRHASVKARIVSLTEELNYWKSETVDDQRGLGRHHWQVRRLDTTLGSLLKPLEKIVDDTPPTSATVLESAEEWEKQILAAHSIWEIFRSKLVVRQNKLFRATLAACDDLAWACYEPAMQYFAPGIKGPPLVFLSTTWSPFAQSRDANFLSDVRASPGTTSALIGDAFQQVLNKLPIPLVGLPWYQTFHMPGAILVAHEVGHIVEADFGLTADIAAAIDRAAPRDIMVWQGWASEVFADVYGCVTMGPSFVGALIDFLATSVSAVKGDTRRSGKYPTRALRIDIALHVMEHIGHAAAVPDLRAAWQSVYGPIEDTEDFATTIKAFAEDAGAVARALCDGPYMGRGQGPGIALPVIPNIRPAIDAAVVTIAKYAAQGNGPKLQAYTDPRLLFAAAQWLHENPQPRPKPEAFDLLVKQTVERQSKPVRGTVRGVRGNVPQPTAPPTIGVLTAEQRRTEDEADRRTGEELFALLTTAPADPPAAAEPRDPRGS